MILAGLTVCLLTFPVLLVCERRAGECEARELVQELDR